MPNSSRYLISTRSKLPHRYPDSYPKTIERGKGAYVYDAEDNAYFDFVLGLGPIILGYGYSLVDDAVIKTIRDCGTIFSLANSQEWLLASILAEMIPCAEVSQFAHNGKDVTEAAIRLARYVTGKELILSFSYHGASDVFMACTKADAGVPQCLKKTITEFDYNEEKRLIELFDKHAIAGVILEPHTIRSPKPTFLPLLRELCDKYDALLIFDEVVTFPRYLGFSAQKYFSVTPDLCCISKGMANGYAISALCGKEKYMKNLCDNKVFFSTTFGGNLVGVSAAIATLTEVRKKNVPKRLHSLGTNLQIKENPRVKLVGLSCRQFLECSDTDRQKIWQEMIKPPFPVFMGVPIFFNYSQTIEEMWKISAKLNSIIKRLDKIELEGRQISEVFKKV